MAEDKTIEDVKKQYSDLQVKYNLPGFDALNEDFGVCRADVDRIDLLLKEIRRFLSDKLRSYESFIEAILNPSNAGLLIFTFVKALSSTDKEKLTEIYKKLASFELELMSLDLKYSEEEEARFIKEFFEFWQIAKEDLLLIVGNVKENWSKESKKSNNGYFG